MSVASTKASNLKKLQKGQVIVRRGDAAAKELYMILQGSVGVYRDYGLAGQTQVQILGQGSFFGEMALFLGKEHAYTIVALNDVLVLVLGRKNFAEFFSGQPDMAFTFVEGLCKRLDDATAALEKYELTNLSQHASRQSPLFPEGHGSYVLKLNNDNEEMIYEQNLTCPICGHTFPSLTVLSSRLRPDRTDSDQRVRYKGVEPLYYEVVTCPSCLLSATVDQFPDISRSWRDDLEKQIGPYRLGIEIKTGMQRDTFTVFAGYYLALISAAACFDDYQMVTGSLWQKLSRLYQDCGDAAMFTYASKRSLEEYIYAYEHFRISDRMMTQLCSVIGELYARLGDIDSARQYYFQVKTSQTASPIAKRQADQRLEELKALKENS